jgi:competence protein ComEC
MRSAKTRITVLLFIIPILSFLAACVTTPSPAPITRPKLEPTITSNTEKLNVHFIEMEFFGDAILIDLGRTEILIDGGFGNSGVASYLQNYVDGPLEAMVVTHPHPDHFGGLIEVLKRFEVNQIWLNGDIPPEGEPYIERYKYFETLVSTEGASIHEARRGQTIDIGILSFAVLHPDTLVEHKNVSLGSRDISMNNNSIVLRLRYGNISFLFTGDIHKETENKILRAGLEVRADILKVGHHGSALSSTERFLKSVKPKVAVYMAGEKQPEQGPKKPHQETIAALKKVGAEVYGTTTHATIIISTDGITYTVETQK